MISVTLNDILEATETFNIIMQQTFNGSLAFKIARLVREINKETETFNEQRMKLLNEYCVKDENGNLKQLDNGNVQVIPEKIQEFNDNFNTLLSTKIEINADKLPLENIDNFNITPQQMLSIEKFFE